MRRGAGQRLDLERKLELMFHILHDQVTQLGEVYASGRSRDIDMLMVIVRTADYAARPDARPIEGANEQIAMVEKYFGMERVDMPKARAKAAGRYRLTYMGVTAQRAAELRMKLGPAPSFTRSALAVAAQDDPGVAVINPPALPAPAALASADLTVLPSAQAAPTAPLRAFPVAPPVNSLKTNTRAARRSPGRFAQSKLAMRLDIGGWLLGHTIYGELKHTKTIYERRSPGSANIDDEDD
jgi:hypothetical protein